MRSPFLLALFGIVALGVGAVLVISAGTRPQQKAEAAARQPPSEALTADWRPIAPAPVAAPPSVAAAQVVRVEPPPVAPTQAPVSAPVRAAPAPAPELAEGLASDDADERAAAMLELRQRRRQSSMEWLNRRRGR